MKTTGNKKGTKPAGSVLAVVLTSILVSWPGVAGGEPGEQEAEQRVFQADKGPGYVDVSSFPVPIQERYGLFSRKCSKCHTLARPINTNFSNAKWKRYVKRMSNKPDSGISPTTGKKIYQFLKYYQASKNRVLGLEQGELLRTEQKEDQH